MRRFTDFERDIINVLLLPQSINSPNKLKNILFDKNTGVLDKEECFAIFHPNENESILYYKEEIDQGLGEDDLYDIAMNFSKKLYSVINLIKYLIKNEYLVFSKDKTATSTADGSWKEFNIIDKDFQKDVFYYDFGTFIPTDNLQSLYDNDFISPEEAKEEKKDEADKKFQKRLENRTLIVSIIAIGVSLLSSLITAQCTTDVKIVNEEFFALSEKQAGELAIQKQAIERLEVTLKSQQDLIDTLTNEKENADKTDDAK